MMSTSAVCCRQAQTSTDDDLYRQAPTPTDALLWHRLMITVADQRSLAKNVNTLNFTA